MKVERLYLTALWQTVLALPLALLVYMLGVLVGGGLFACFNGAPVIPGNDFSRVLFLSAAGWIGVWSAFHMCEWLFSFYSRWAVIVMLALVAFYNVVGEIGNPIFWDVTARVAQGIVTCVTAYAFFHHETARRKRLQLTEASRPLR